MLATSWWKRVEYLLSERLWDKFANLLHNGKTWLEERPLSFVTFGWRQILPMFLTRIQNHRSLGAHHPLNTQHFVQRPLPTSQSKPVKQFLTFLNSSHPANHFLSTAYFFFKISLASSFHFPPYFTPGSLKGFQLDFLFLVFPKSFNLKITWEHLCSILSLAKLGDCQPVRQNNFRNLQV